MSIAIAETVAREQQPANAAQLAARIQIPAAARRYDGQPLQHLSHSSYSRCVLCPEDWRRRYMLGEKKRPRDRCSSAARRRRDLALLPADPRRHEQLASTRSRTRSGTWQAEPTQSASNSGSPGNRPPSSAFELGLEAVELTFEQLATPRRAGRRPAKVEYTLAPGSSGASSATSTSRPRRRRRAIGRRRRLQGQDHAAQPAKADHDSSPRVPRRALARRRPAEEFCFAQIAKPGICRFLHMPGYVARGTMLRCVRDVGRMVEIGAVRRDIFGGLEALEESQ